MSNPLKRRFDPVRELDDEPFFTSSVEPQQPYAQEVILDYDGFHDSMRQSQYHGPSFMNPMSDAPIIQQAESSPEVYLSNILVDPNLVTSMSSMNFDGLDFLDDQLTDWSNDVLSSGSDLSPLGPLSSQEVSHSPSAASEAYQPRIEDVIPTFNTQVANNEVANTETICYGMLHDVDVKLLGDMQTIYSKLDKRDAGLERLKLERRENHVILRFNDTGEDFGQVRSIVGTTLSSLLGDQSSNVDFEPIVSISYLMDIIGRANRPSEAIVKVDINVYGPQSAAMKIGDDLSSGKLWLQKPGNMRCDVIYDNPHFLRLKMNGVQLQPKQPIPQAIREGSSSRRRREERLRNMLEEVYKSINTREINAVGAGDRVVKMLKRHQEEALGFMLERESGHINDTYRLWESIPVEGGNTEYRHKITRAKVRTGIQPIERGGGILADEMGMGKTLSMLTLIVKTIDDGKEWAEQQENGAKVDETIKRSRSTLVIVPSALLINNWVNEIAVYLKHKVKVIKYHGSDRPKDIEQIADSDIVVTTYSTLTAEYQVKSKPSPLHCVDWFRVVLDEAHIIRRRATAFYHACDAIHANSRWCLTGTPIQNKLADIGTLFAFIRAEPFTKAATFRKYIEVPFEQIPENESPTLAKDRLVLLFQAFCLRRTKEIIHLPQLRKTVRKLSFSVEEREQYKNTMKILRRKILNRVGEAEQNSKFGTFQINLQMRLLCNHGTWQQPFSWDRRSYQDAREALISAVGENSEITCAGCQMPMPILGSSQLNHRIYEQCAHVLCSDCLEQSNTPNDRGKAQHCPVCIHRLRHAMIESGAIIDDDSVPNCRPKDKAGGGDDYFDFNIEGYSTKMNALIEDVQRDLWKSKSIIFSCWTRTLQLLRKYLDRANIPYLAIDGNCSLKEREHKLAQFENEEEMKPVLIMTTGTGGFGLNITCANRIFIVELQWNPAVESQAIARAIRLGQEKNVHVTRYMIKDTVEEEMGSQQKSKNQLASLVDAGDDMDWQE
ncbi:putative SWI/SNF-related matrix-associated actin-dependent regulator of chromatin [Trichoderma lentiforme]|uniref:SWI/SNF-related matrix-associated actin-dependent regulator of chromatin n=1 Tax=Trichoderma lentiforme TaxID=1567552 RepID=A0A9P4XRG5_9HYPO|nr:putative SWI/SNF-related matrix-associated actin-dependent regulator of chromatin [Trichoderma lentiforme]